jgi:hypothetical protein
MIYYNTQALLKKRFSIYDKHIIVKSRQVGMTTLLVDHVIDVAANNEKKQIAFITWSNHSANSAYSKALDACRSIDCAVEKNRKAERTIDFKNGSKIFVFAHSGSMQHQKFDLAVLDEAASFFRIENINKILLSKKLIISSTPAPSCAKSDPGGKWFKQLFLDAECNINGLQPSFARWYSVPGRDIAWLENMAKFYTPTPSGSFEHEILANF